MSQNIMTHSFNGRAVRTVFINNEIWWVAKDVCDVLDLSDVSMALRGLDDDEKLIQPMLVSGQNRSVLIISEPGLYSLLFKSRKPEAKEFQRWITHEVIPAIINHGFYLADKKAADFLEDPLDAIQDILDRAKELQAKNTLLEEEDEKKQLKLLNAQLIKELCEQANEIEVLTSLVNRCTCPEQLTLSTIVAKMLGMTAVRLNKFLIWAGVFYRKNGMLLPCAKYESGQIKGASASQQTEERIGKVSGRNSLWKWTSTGVDFVKELWDQKHDEFNAWEAAQLKQRSKC